MPFERPSLTDLRAQVAQSIASALPGVDPLLPFSNMGILGQVLAGMTHMHYGYLDWIAQQSNPFTCSGEYLEAWAALQGVYRVAASRASGTVRFNGANGTTLPAGTALTRGDGVAYTTTSSGTVSGGFVIVMAMADEDASGLTGATGNCNVGSVLSLTSAVAGITGSGTVAAAMTGGADLETDDSLRSRMLQAYQSPPHGGKAEDYVTWARAVAGVSRAWCVPHGYGPGTVLVYVMLDVAQAVHGGFPQGTNGCAAGETRDSAALGDQLTVANAILPLQPVTALVYVMAPTPHAVDFTISGLSVATTETKQAVADAIAGVLAAYGAIAIGSTTVALSLIETAIAAVPNTTGFVVLTPAGNVTSAPGSLPVLGTITWA